MRRDYEPVVPALASGQIQLYAPTHPTFQPVRLDDRGASDARRDGAVGVRDGTSIAREAVIENEHSFYFETPDGLQVSRVDMNLWAESVRNPAVGRLANTTIRDARWVM